jgi:RHS repeat-associated protein
LVDEEEPLRISHFAYDSEGRLVVATDPLGHSTLFEHNVFGQVVSVENALGSRTEYTYDRWGQRTGRGQRASASDPLTREITWEHDFIGRVIRETRADGQHTEYRYAYDDCGCSGASLGRITAVEIFDGQETSLRRVERLFNDEGELIETSWGGESGTPLEPRILRSYVTEPPSPTGDQWMRLLAHVEDEALKVGDSRTSFTYDSRGRLIAVTDPDGAETSYDYDAFDRRTRVQDPDGNATEYEWNSDGTLAAVHNGFGQTTSHSYDPDSGRLSTASNANGTSTDYTYNGWGQLKSVTHRSVSDETLAAFYYLYDDLGLPSKIEFEDYRYVLLDHDVLGQLTAETWYAADDTELWSRTYDYDAFGNRTEVTLVRGPASSPDDTEATTSTFNELDQLVSDGSRTFTYDAFGNLTSVVMSSELVWAYSHDARTNQLLRARLYHSDSEAAPLQDVHMLYDPLGRRMLRWDESRVRTRTFYDGFNTLLEREMRPRRLKVQDDFHREPYQYWNASTPKEDFGPWSPYEAFIGGLPEPYPSNWDGYYNLDGNPSLQAENLILYYGSGPSESPALPHAPAIAHDLIEPVTDPFLWAGADSQTRGTASVPKPTLRLVFGWRDADGDFIHDAGDDAWAAGLEWGDGDLYWFVDRWGPNDNEWGREASTSTSFAYEDTNDPEPEPFAVDVDSTVPGVDGTRITVHAWDSTNMVWDPVFSHDTEDPIPAGRVGFQGEVPYAGSGDPPSRSAGATPFWVWNWGAIASMVRTDGDFVEERLLETNNAASDEADYEVYDDSPSGADVAIAYSSDRLSNVLVFDGAAGADHVQTWSGTNPAWYEDNGTNLTFQFRATDSPPVTDRPQFLVQLRCDVDGDGGVDSRYLTYVVGDGSDTTNAPTHTTNKIYLDPALADGTWQTFSRDVRGDWLDLTGLDAQDLTMLRWRGNLELDTLRLTTSTTRRVHTNAPTALGGTISVREVDEETGANSDTWLHHDRMGSVVLQTDAAGSPLLAFPATGRVVEAASGSGLDPRWRVVRGNLSLESSDSLAALLERPEAQALTGTIASGDSNFQIIAGEQSGWYGNSNDDEWNEATSHIVSLALSREANVLMTIRGQQSSGEVVEINLRFGSSGDSTYTGGSGYPGVNHYEDIPAGVWGHAAFDAAEVIREQYGESVDLAEIDAISVWGYGKTEIADLALLGTTHAAYTAWGESLASAQTGDLLSPLAQAAAWLRAGETSPIGWQSKALDPALGLHFNHARFYSAGLGRFTQASPLGADFEHLYGYGLNSPLGFTDIDGFREVAYDDGFGRPVFADEMRYREGPSDVNTGWQVDGRFVGDFAWEAAKRAPRAIGEEIIWTYTGGKLLKWAWWLGKGGWRLGRYCLGLTDEAAAAAARAQGAGAAAAAAGSAGELSGQVHHAISRRIHRALESHPNLSGRYSYRDPRFATQARDLASHSGYQRWHIDLDDEIVDWIRTNPTATPQQFEAYLQGVYRRSEIMQSFPNAL